MLFYSWLKNFGKLQIYTMKNHILIKGLKTKEKEKNLEIS